MKVEIPSKAYNQTERYQGTHMISRLFKKGTKKKEEKKKMSSNQPIPEGRKKTTTFQKVLTAEGWKRLMMRKYGKGKKK